MMLNSDFISIYLGLIEGFALIISPCILPVLPIILAGALSGSKRRPIGIVTGFTLTFALFAYFSRYILQYSGVDLNLIRHISYGILIFFGLVMISNYLTEKFAYFTRRLTEASSILSKAIGQQNGFYSGLFIGGLVAIVWTPCAGPILAAVIVQIAIQKTSFVSFLTLLAFAMGASIPMLIIAAYGLKIRVAFGFFKSRAFLFRKLLGVVIIASVGYMIYQENETLTTTTSKSTIRTLSTLEQGLWRPYPAPEIGGITDWINSPPLQLAELKGKVVLLDFWTYSCINCVRTLPYLKDWYKKYHDKGLMIIGVHTPEFEFEKNVDNVKSAVIRYGIDYPVALDNNFVTWSNFSNHFWPAHYLINKQGNVVYEHFGEGEYDVTENNIRFLLGMNNVDKFSPTASKPYLLADIAQTPETYLGYGRADTSSSPSLTPDKVTQYAYPAELPSNAWGLQGDWQINADKIVSAQANVGLNIHFSARKVFIVMGNSTAKPIRVNLLFNGKPLGTNTGIDVTKNSILVDKHSIYEVLALPLFSNGVLEVIATEPGLEIYTFTFGS